MPLTTDHQPLTTDLYDITRRQLDAALYELLIARETTSAVIARRAAVCPEVVRRIRLTLAELGLKPMRSQASPAELEYLRAHHGRLPGREIARHLGRTPTSVYQAARRIGLPLLVRRIDWTRLDPTIRRLNAEGYLDGEIAAALGDVGDGPLDRRTLQDHRRKLGLPSNANNHRHRRQVGERTRRQCERAGVESLAQVRELAFRRWAREAGWPEDLRPRAVAILNALWELGPMTRREIAAAVGMPWKGPRQSLHSNDPEGTYLATLMARGLVVRLGRTVKTGPRRGAHCNLYALPLGVEPAAAGSTGSSSLLQEGA